MKQALLAGVLFLVFGIVSFLYRNAVERPAAPAVVPACAQDALLCPDGTALSRVPPSCAFPACPQAAVEGEEPPTAPTTTPVVSSPTY